MQQERRLSSKLINYWQSLKQGEALPEEKDVLPDALPEIWDSCFLIQRGVPQNPEGFRYSYLGKALLQSCVDAKPATRRFLENVLRLHESSALVAEQALEDEGPVERFQEFHDEETGVIFKYRQCFVPLRDGSGEPGAVLGGLRWKIY